MDAATIACLALDHQQRTERLTELAERVLAAGGDDEHAVRVNLAALEQGVELLWAIQVSTSVLEQRLAQQRRGLLRRFTDWLGITEPPGLDPVIVDIYKRRLREAAERARDVSRSASP